jgi:hypothetical protein
MRLTPDANLINFLCKFTYSFCKINHFLALQRNIK